jgi:nucleoside-diphosphate-sugar epimerase
MKILVTGATGFVGQALCAELVRCGHKVRGALRRIDGPGRLTAGVDAVVTGSIAAATNWSAALRGVDVVIHLAARVHVMQDEAADPLAEYRRVNLYGTANLARQAKSAGVRRLVFVSSVKVNGEEIPGEQSYTERQVPSPRDPYGISKWEAEQALQEIARETGLEAVIVRPPLVYGPGVGGNFRRLLELVDCGIPLPLASVANRRSMIYLGNLVDLLAVCACHPAAAGKTFLVSDGEDVSTARLIRELARLLGRPVRLWPLPPVLLRLAGRLAGRRDEVERLCGSLVIDSSKIRRETGWAPPFSMAQGLAATAGWFQQRHSRDRQLALINR